MFTFNVLPTLVLAASIAGPIAAAAMSIPRSNNEIQIRAEGNVDLWKRVDDSRWTFYNTETGNAGSCGQFLSNSGFTVAMNQAQMTSSLCFKTISMSFGGKTTTATIQDTCPGCPEGGLDLTPALFSFFAPESDGVIFGSWELLD